MEKIKTNLIPYERYREMAITGQKKPWKERGFTEPHTGEAMKLDLMEEQIRDIRKTLAGDSSAKKWKELKAELTRKEDSLRYRLETYNHNCLPGNERYSDLVTLRKHH